MCVCVCVLGSSRLRWLQWPQWLRVQRGPLRLHTQWYRCVEP